MNIPCSGGAQEGLFSDGRGKVPIGLSQIAFSASGRLQQWTIGSSSSSAGQVCISTRDGMSTSSLEEHGAQI